MWQRQREKRSASAFASVSVVSVHRVCILNAWKYIYCSDAFCYDILFAFVVPFVRTNGG